MRLDNTIACLTPALLLLTELKDAFGPPFVQSIANTIQSLINVVQNVKRNKTECAQVMEPIHQIVYGILNLYIKSETVGSLPPLMLYDVGRFMETLHKIYTYIETQQEGNKIKNLFRINEMKNLLRDCHAGLNQAMEVFGIQTQGETLNDAREFKNRADLMHSELIKMVETLSDTSIISEGASVLGTFNESGNSSTSFSMLPSQPKIFHGREQELENVLKLLSETSPRIAILGGGGMGKTSLARAALHHPDIASKFEHIFFVSAEAATTSIELAALLGLHLGLNPGRDLTKAVVQLLSRTPASLLILDNLETVWEPMKTRAGVEKLLCLLSEVGHLALMITMRGAERPAHVQWTHPFLLPLQPLSDDAAKQTFMDITDDAYTVDEVDQLLGFTGNMPLAVDLIAHLTDYEGLPNILSRWESEKTSMLSVGLDRQSNLDASISLSLSSPRITAGSKELLRLLSILPNGLSDVELVQADLGIANILSSKAVLMATSLAYQDRNKRLLLLMPIREYIQRLLPPSESSIHLLQRHFYALLNLYKTYGGPQLQPVVKQITVNLANLYEVLKRGLYPSAPTLAETIYCVLYLNSFHRITGRDHTTLMNDIKGLLPELCDHQLEICFLLEVLMSPRYWPLVSQETIAQAIGHLGHINDPLLQSKFYTAAGIHSFSYKSDSQEATKFLKQALQLSELCGDITQQCNVLLQMSSQEHRSGLHSSGLNHASVAWKLAKLSGDLYQQARANQEGAMCSIGLGEYQQCAAQLQSARELLCMCGMSGGSVDRSITVLQAEVHLLKSEYSQCRDINSYLVENTSPQENSLFHAIALLNIAQIDTIIGVASQEVYHNLHSAREIFRNDNHPKETLFMCDTVQASMELRDGEFTRARDTFETCLHLSWGTSHGVGSVCLAQLANIKSWPASASQYKWPTIYLAFACKSKDKLALHQGLLFFGDIFIINDDEYTATNLYHVALAGFTQMDVHHSRAQCMSRLGDLANKQGDTSEAITFWKAAQPLFERSSQSKDVTEIHSKLARIEQAYPKNIMTLETLNAPVHLVTEISEIENGQSMDEHALGPTASITI
ncbi:hypothetical protein K438DRAFT_1857718 [Mycena galopus ATCC 62051]|nr:hypothetical protein K438DRAFT_1857718 [Mycena galopus ATCC 62051]